MDYKAFVGSRIKMFRENKNISQEELARKLGYSHKTSISNIEAGKANIPSQKLFKFADALGISVDDLIGDESPVNVTNAIEMLNEMDSMQHILRMLSTMDIKKLQQIESIIETFTED